MKLDRRPGSAHFRRHPHADPAHTLEHLHDRRLVLHPKGGPEAANARPLGWVILISWLLAGVEYSLAVPANRIGYAGGWTPGQLKIAQEAIALTVFGVLTVTVLGEPLTWRDAGAFACVMAACAFLFAGK